MQVGRMSDGSRANDAELSIDEKTAKFREAWDAFVEGPLPAITAVFVDHFEEKVPVPTPATIRWRGAER